MGCDNKEMCDTREFYRNNYIENQGFPSNYMYGHAYVPNQVFRGNSFCPKDGLESGTMFPELVSPYAPLDSMRVIETLKKEGRDF